MRDRIAVVALIAIGSALLPATAYGDPPPEPKKDAAGMALFPAAAIKWQEGPPSLPKGAMVAALEGDPGKAGPFVLRVKMPDGYRVPPHTHPKTERITVISGTLYLGMGEKFTGRRGGPCRRAPTATGRPG